MEETAQPEAEAEGDFHSVSQTMMDISKQFDSSQGNLSPSTAEENIHAYIRYKEWLETLKQMQNGVINSSDQTETASVESDSREDITSRLAVLQDELLRVSSDHAVKELVVRSAQLGNILQELLFPQPRESVEEEEDRGRISWAGELCDRQRVLSSDILAHHGACQTLQDEIDQRKKDIRDMQASNMELMKRLQSRERDERTVTQPSRSLQQQQDKLEGLVSHITMEKGILQGLIIGSGVNWAKDPALKEVVIGLGKQLDLD